MSTSAPYPPATPQSNQPREQFIPPPNPPELLLFLHAIFGQDDVHPLDVQDTDFLDAFDLGEGVGYPGFGGYERGEVEVCRCQGD